MAKSLRSRRKKRVKKSKSELLKTKSSWRDEAEQKKREIMEAVLNGPKAELVQEKNTLLLLERRKEEDARKEKIKAQKAAIDQMENFALGDGVGKVPEDDVMETEDRKKIRQLHCELAVLRKQVARRKGKVSKQRFQAERKARIKEILELLKPLEQQKSGGDEAPHVVKSHKSKKKSGNPLGVKAGGVAKHKGERDYVKPPRDADGDDMEDDVSVVEASVPAEGGDTNAFDGGVMLKIPAHKRRKGQGKNLKGSEWLKRRRDDKKTRRLFGSTRASRQRKRFEFKGIYQFYPKPAATRTSA